MNAAERFRRLTELERERLRIQAEITSYPMPIPACDVFFNDLLEQRGRVCAELKALRQAMETETHGA